MAFIRDFYERTKEATLYALRTSPVEVAIGAVLGCALASGISYRNEKQRTHCIPLAFSEITQIEKDAQEQGVSPGPFNIYLPKVNDSAMKIF